MDVFALNLRLKEEGASAVKSSVDKLKRSFDDASKGATGFDRALSGLKGKLIGIASVATVGLVIKKITEESSQAQFAQAQLQAALKSTGNVAGQTVDGLNAHAAALQRVSVFGDDAITKAQALLLTFTKVGGDAFPRATQAIVDMATAMGTDLQGATIQIGKALNDPILGVTALGRAGVQFSQSQKDMIKSLVESNRVMDAQNMILKELETQFGGSALAARNTLGGALAGLKNAFGDLFELSGEGSRVIITLINNLADFLGRYAGALDRFVAATLRALVKIKTELRVFDYTLQKALVNIPAFLINLLRPLENIPVIGSAIKSVLDSMEAPLRRVWDSADANQKKWREWEQQQYAAISATKQLKEAVTATAAATGGGVGGAAGPRLAPLGPIGGATMATRVLPPELSAITAADLERVKASTKSLADGARLELLEYMETLSTEMTTSIRDTFVDSIANGIQEAIATGSIGEGFKALGRTLLAGLGSMLVDFGKYLIATSGLFAALRKALVGAITNPYALAAIGAAMIGLGAGLRGAAQSIFGGPNTAQSSTPAMGGFMGSTGGGRMPTMVFGPTMAGAAAGNVSAAVPMNVTIIGPNDPTAQRAMQELITKANRRGNV